MRPPTRSLNSSRPLPWPSRNAISDKSSATNGLSVRNEANRATAPGRMMTGDPPKAPPYCHFRFILPWRPCQEAPLLLPLRTCLLWLPMKPPLLQLQSLQTSVHSMDQLPVSISGSASIIVKGPMPLVYPGPPRRPRRTVADARPGWWWRMPHST